MIGRSFRVALVVITAVCPPASAGAQVPASEYAERRAALLAKLPSDAVLIALGAHEPAQDYLSFYQTPSFNYLTGFLEPDAALVAIKTHGTSSTTLFVEPRDPSREMWVGARMGPEGATRRTGLPARDISHFAGFVDSLADTKLPIYVAGDFGGEDAADHALTADQQWLAALHREHPGAVVKTANSQIEQLRGTKSPAELALIRRAASITASAEAAAMQALQPGMNEYELQAIIEYTFRRSGAERPSFASIVGSGPNATALHYNANDRKIDRGDIVVMDVGASYQGYAADVTRSIPASGTYSTEQRAVYQVVRDAQAAAERQAKLGAPAHLMSDSATAVLAAGLTRLGLIESPWATYDCDLGGQTAQCSQYQLFYPHALGHGIGLEVHDPEQFYYTQTISAGSAFTIEPGLYIRADVLDVLPQTPRNRALTTRLQPAVQRYRSIGIRIEDDYIATASGVERISLAPREIAEIEALMSTPRTRP